MINEIYSQITSVLNIDVQKGYYSQHYADSIGHSIGTLVYNSPEYTIGLAQKLIIQNTELTYVKYTINGLSSDGDFELSSISQFLDILKNIGNIFGKGEKQIESDLLKVRENYFKYAGQVGMFHLKAFDEGIKLLNSQVKQRILEYTYGLENYNNYINRDDYSKTSLENFVKNKINLYGLIYMALFTNNSKIDYSNSQITIKRQSGDISLNLGDGAEKYFRNGKYGFFIYEDGMIKNTQLYTPGTDETSFVDTLFSNTSTNMNNIYLVTGDVKFPSKVYDNLCLNDKVYNFEEFLIENNFSQEFEDNTDLPQNKKFACKFSDNTNNSKFVDIEDIKTNETGICGEVAECPDGYRCFYPKESNSTDCKSLNFIENEGLVIKDHDYLNHEEIHMLAIVGILAVGIMILIFILRKINRRNY